MPSPQRLQTAVPLDQQSVLPTVRGVPWWGAVLLATGITALGAAIDASGTDQLGSIYKFCYLVGCVLAALAVRRRALFTAAAQPPLIAFFISIVTLYGANSNASSGLKGFIFNVLLPIASEFPWMATTFVVTLGMVLARWFLTREKSDDTAAPRSRRAASGTEPAKRSTARSASPTRARTAEKNPGAEAPEKKTTPGTSTAGGPGRRRAKAAPDRSAPDRTARNRTARNRTASEQPAEKASDDLPPGWTSAPPVEPERIDSPAPAPRRRASTARPTVADLRAPDLTPSDVSAADTEVADTRPGSN